ncbi:hypothetical protein CALCODRAFT_451259 [Calocera cornea HHB12733]|uniref:Peptidase S33 tripeptidyl aminopeptidase-like C-terminal domain-containing protein n=1 Tax=Calocera cornea HHB12733 TaxID=1353952 RepID=A0A165GZH9_9BASI|nr:hypothetical protein CALCODRAFT_451259 [Calocera cornea HHB12733]
MGRPRQAILDAAHARARARAAQEEEGARWANLGQGALTALACCLLLAVAYLRTLPFCVFPLCGRGRDGLGFGLGLVVDVSESGSGGGQGKTTTEDWRSLPVGTVRWWTCGSAGQSPRPQCGFVIVPTDYHDPSAGTTKVALARANATASPRKGIVIFGAGGPGGAGGLMVSMGAGTQIQQTVTGEHYDIVGIDPRGIGDTEPKTQCLPPGQNNALKAHTVLERNFDYSSRAVPEELRASLLRQQEEMDALVQVQYRMCAVNMGKKVRYMGTTTVVRDIEFVTRVLEGGEALINYYGGSYGSIIGQYLVNMFPDRLGKVAIEGIVDGVSWANQPMYKSYRQWMSSTEDAYDWFVHECAKAGPGTCELATSDNEDPARIRARIEKLFDDLYERPLPVATKRFWGVVTSGMARALLFRMLQMPTIWPTIAVSLAQAMRGDGQAVLMLDSVFSGYRDLERQAVSCNDAPKPPLYEPPTNGQLVDEILGIAKDVTGFAFSILTAEPDASCHYWPFFPPERFTGPWNHTLRNPILVMSNTADPVTPISSARLVKDLLGESAILVLQHGPGHGTTSVPTSCTMNKSRAYFTDGTLPKDGHTCELEYSLFPDSGRRYLEAYSAEERARLEAAEKLYLAMRGVDLSRLSSM